MQYPIIDFSVTAIQFKMCFTQAERLAIRALRQTDQQVDDMFDLLDDPRTLTVNLALPQVQEMMQHLVDVNIIDSDRMYQILHAYIPGTDNPPVYTPDPEPVAEAQPEA